MVQLRTNQNNFAILNRMQSEAMFESLMRHLNQAFSMTSTIRVKAIVYTAR